MICKRDIIFRLILLLLIAGIGTPALAQNPVFRNYSEEEGLPGNDVFDVLVDRNGIMWFATDQGVSMYDSRTFKNYSTANGLPTNTIIKLHDDNFGKLWFLAYNGMLGYYDGKIAKPYEFNDSLLKHYSDNYFSKIVVDSTGGILLSPRRGGYAKISADGKIIARTELIPYPQYKCYLAFDDLGSDYFQTIQNDRPAARTDNGKLSVHNSSYFLEVDYSPRDFHRNYEKLGEGEYLVSHTNCLFHIKDKHVVGKRVFKEEIIDLYIDSQQNLWVSIKYENGIYMFEMADFQTLGTHFLDGYTVTSVTQDLEGNYWFGTEGYGVFFLPTFHFKRYNLPGDARNLNVLALKISGNRIWYSTRDKKIFTGVLDNGNLSNIRRLEIEEPYDQVKCMEIDSEGYLWLSSTRSIKYDPAGFPKKLDTIVNTSFLSKGHGDTIFIGTSVLGAYYKDKLIEINTQDSSRRMYTAYHDRCGKIWLGTLYGLHAWEEGKVMFRGQMSPFLGERINVIDKIGGMLVVGTASHGLLFLKDDTVAFHIEMENGLLGNFVKSMYVQNDTILWVGTKDGLNEITFTNDYSDYETLSFGNSDGLPSKEISGISMHDGYVWLATGNGLVSFDPNSLAPHMSPPRIQITGIQIGGRDTTIQENYTLAYDQNNIRFSFNGISYRSDEDLRYRYQLANYNDFIIETRNNWADFPNLPPGDYTFFVNAGNIHGVWNEEPMSITFRIRKHFTQTVWFIIFLIVLSSAAIIMITMYFQRQRKIKENAKNELARLEQRLFRLQMNPHFVFNALLAIQGFMYMNKPREAGRYLTSFAKLIRHTLYGSSEEYLSLDKEIEALQYYLELQRLRFNEEFDFKIKIIGDIIPESIEIPPLLIQPFLENSIEHGLQYLKGKGLLVLRISMKDDCLYVEVEDNGIGREKAMKLQKKKIKLHKSMGMHIVNQRVESLNRIMPRKIQMEIEDLTDEKGKSRGTLVRLCIPFRNV